MAGMSLQYKLIDTGGIGKVYRVTDRETNRTWAEKIINYSKFNDRELAEEIFDHEVNMMQEVLGVASAVQFHEAEKYRGGASIRMEYLSGTSLDRYLADPEKLQSEKLQILGQTGLIINELHDRGIIHADIKPGNFFATDHSLKIFDFGYGRSPKNPWKFNLKPPTVEYCSPEQARKEEIDEHSDEFSYAVMIYAFITNKFHFGSRPQVTREMIQTRARNYCSGRAFISQQSLVKDLSEYSEELADVIGPLLSPEPAERTINPLIEYLLCQ